MMPRHFMVVSIPVTHPDTPPRNGMIRGFYESIEMIREIPLPASDDAETNPVEWIMVTRSDPGGGIPRFMVERSVPSSIVQDAVKFLDWACAKDDAPDAAHTDESAVAQDADRQPSINEPNGTTGVGNSIKARPSPVLRRVSHSVEQDDNATAGSW